MNEDYCEVIITASNAAWLADFTRSLVDARLAACGQNIAGIWSIYRWQGNIEDEGDPWGWCACSRSAFCVAASSRKPGVRCRAFCVGGGLGRQAAGGGPG